MIYTSTELFNAFKEDTRQIVVRVKINGAVFDNDNISTLNLEYGSMDGANFSLGSTFASSLKITFAELVEGLAELDEIEVELGAVLPDETIEYVKMGTFIINEEVMMDRNNNTTSIDAMDRMVMLGEIYEPTLKGDYAQIIDIAVDIANQAGVVVSNDFDRLRTDSIQIPREKTLREAIGIIAQFEVGFATFNRDGELAIRRLNDPNFNITPEDYTMKGLVKNEVPFRLNGAQCKVGDSEEDALQTGASTGTQIVLNNPSMTQEHLDRIYTELSTLNYYPFSLDWYGHPALEAGDWIEIEDLQGNKFKTPNLHYTLDFNGGLKAKSQAETTSSSEVVYQYKSPLKQEIQAITARLSASGGNHVYDDLTEPENPKEGDLWFKPEGPDTIILIYERLEDGSLDWVEKLNTGETTKNADAIEKTLEEVEEAKRQAKSDANQAYEEARAHADAELERINTELSTDIGGAIELAEQAKADAVTKANQALEDAKAHAESEDARIKQEIGLEVDGAIEIAEQAKQDATDKANQAYEDAKAHADAEILQFSEHFDGVLEDVESDVADAQATADSAVEQIDTAVANAGFTSLDETINNVRGIASGVKSELDVAIENAGFTSLDETLQNMNYITMDAEQSAQQAITDAQQAIDNASNAYGLAQTSISEAQTAQENSLTALGKADNALDGVSNLDIRVDDVEAELELKADNAFMNEDGTLTTLSNAITFNAHRFSSDMSRIESRVESLAGEINLVILRDAFEETRVIGGEVYPNPTPHSRSDTMREMISVTPGEKLAISKESSSSGYDWFTINYYDENYVYKDLLHTSSNQRVITIPPGVYKMWVAYPVESKPQITRGTNFLPYRPNIADQMTADEVTIFRNEYDEFADKTERRLSSIDSSGGRLATAELLITQTADGLALKADQTTVNELTGEVESLGTEFDVVAGQVSSRVWNTDIESAIQDIDIGGRNLLKNTATFDAPWDSGHYLGMNDPLGENNAVKLNPDRPYLGYLVSQANMSKFEPGQYVLSFWAKGDSIRTHRVGYRNGNAGPRIDFEVTPEWNHYIIKFETTDVATAGRVVFWDSVDGLILAYPKLEKGNTATDWTPAPEDTTTLINHVESELTQKHDTIEATVSSVDGRVATNKLNLDGLTTTVQDVKKDLTGTTTLLNTTRTTVSGHTSSISTLRTDVDGKATTTQFNTLNSTVNGTIQRVGNAEGKITQIENNVDGLQTTVASKASQSQVTQLASGLSSVVRELDDLEVGGRNLFVNTTTWRSPWDSGHYTEVEDPLGENNAVILNPNSQFLGYIVPQANMSKFEPGNYVLSFWAKGDSNRTHSVGYRNGAISPRINFDVTTQWQYYVMKFTTTDVTTTGRVVFWDSIDGLAIAYPKLEKGTIATDWSPAPEDTNTKIDHIETEWTQTFDTFSQTVSNIDGRVTSQKQTLDGLETTIQSTQSDLSGTMTLLNQTKETVDSRTSVLAQLRTDVDGKTTISQFNTLSSTVDGTVTRVGNAEGKITQIETSVNGLQTTVADKASQSQVTQLANGLSSVVKDVSNIPIWTKVLPGASQDNPVELTDLDGNSLSTNSSYEIYLSAQSGTSVDNYSIYAYNNGGFKLIGRSGSGVDASLFRNNNRVWVETNFSNPAQTYHYTATVTELASQGGRSSISQLADNINLRVEKGDVVSQINIEAERTLIQTGKLLLDAKNTIVTGDFAVSGNAIVGGDMQLNKGLRVMNGTNSVLSVVNGNVRMNVGSLFIGSEDVEDKISTAIYQNSKSLGLIYTDEAGQEQSLLSVGADGVYVAGKHILLNGRTVVDGSFTVSGGNVILDGDTTVLGDFTVSGDNVVLDGDTIVTGDFAVLGKNIILDGDTTVTDNFTVTGGSIILDGDTTIHDDFTVTGGNVILNADTRVEGDFTVSGGNVILDGDTTVRGGFTVLGENVTLDANTTILGDFSVFGKNITLDADTTILGDFSVFGKNITLDGDTTVTGDFTVGGELVGPGISADNITAGKLDAGQITVVNLDVSSLSGNTSEFVQSNWNSYAGGNVQITGAGMLTTAPDMSQVQIANGMMYVRNSLGNNLGQIGRIQYSNDPVTHYVRIRTSWGTNFAVTQIYNSNSDYKDTIWSTINDVGSAIVTINASLRMNYENIYLGDVINNASGYIGRTGQTLRIVGPQGGDNESVAIYGGHGNGEIKIGYSLRTYYDGSISNHMWANLDMHSASIVNQSDERLKTKIVANEIDSLSAVKRWKIAGFNWIDTEASRERQFGLIAQSAPEIAFESQDGYLNVNSSKQLQMTTHAVQQLALNQDATTELVESNESKIHKLQQELSKANRRIEELEGAI